MGSSNPQSFQWQLVSIKSPGSSRRSSLGLRPCEWMCGTVDVAVVVVAGSFLTLADCFLVDVSASAVIDRFNVSDAFLHTSMLC